MDRTVITFSAANIITINLMVILMGVLFMTFARVLRGRADG